MFKVQLKTRKGSLEFVADDQQNLMQCAQEFEIHMLSSCRNGTCRTCIAKCESGVVRYDTEWPGLSAEEKAQGWILPCVAIAYSDLVIESAEAYLI